MKKDRENEEKRTAQGISRRSFLTTVGTGTVGAAVVAGTAATAEPQKIVAEPGDLVKVNLRINGRHHRVLVEPRWTLLNVLREHLGMTGTKPSCERGECGACTVLIDGKPLYSCMTLALDVEGREIMTVEGIMDGEKLGPVQRAFVEEDAFQCGYCTPGQVMAAEGLLRKNPNPNMDEIREGMCGNLCRCGTYAHIFKAVRRASELRKRA